MKYSTTDKLNDNMKAKVFKYKSDGNTVVAPYMELEPYAENVYLSLSRKNEYGNEDDDCFHVVCRIENVYFSSGQYSRRFLNGENRRDEDVLKDFMRQPDICRVRFPKSKRRILKSSKVECRFWILPCMEEIS